MLADMSVTRRDGAALSSTTADRGSLKHGLLPISDAASLLGRSIWTLKRLHRGGHLPVVMIGDQWLVPESFVAMVLTSPQPGRPAVLADVAKDWFAVNSGTEAVAAAG